MRSSLDGDEDQGAEVPSVVRDRRRRARCVPDRPVNAGNPRSLTDTFARLLTCAWAGSSIAAYVLLSSRSWPERSKGVGLLLAITDGPDIASDLCRYPREAPST